MRNLKIPWWQWKTGREAHISEHRICHDYKWQVHNEMIEYQTQDTFSYSFWGVIFVLQRKSTWSVPF